MRINITITDNDIRYYVTLAMEELEEENQIGFPDADVRAEFVEDCTAEIIDKIELYDRNLIMDDTEYKDAVLEAAELYGFLCD